MGQFCCFILVKCQVSPIKKMVSLSFNLTNKSYAGCAAVPHHIFKYQRVSLLIGLRGVLPLRAVAPFSIFLKLLLKLGKELKKKKKKSADIQVLRLVHLRV